MTWRLCVAALAFLSWGGFSNPACAQQYDLWQWTTIGIEKKLSPKFSVGVEEEIRLFRDISQLNLSFTSFSASFKPSKFLKLAVNYRFTQKRMDEGYYSFRHRVLCDVTVKNKFNVFVISYRARLQSQIRDIYNSEDGTIPEQYWRNKFDIKLDLDKKISPYVSVEFRYQFGNNRLREANYMFDRGRYYAGMDYAANKRNTFGLYYMYQREFNVNDPERDHVLGISYTISL